MNINRYISSCLFLFFLFASNSVNSQTLSWTSLKQLHGEGEELILNHKVDATGNHFVTGGLDSTLTLGTTTLSTSSVISFIAKLSPALQPDWIVSIEDSLFIYLSDLAIDSSGNTYVSGYHDSSFNVGSLTFTPVGNNDGFIIKIDPQGNPEWLVTLSGLGEDRMLGVTVVPNGAIYVAGAYSGLANFGGTALPASVTNGLIARIDSSGTVQWTKSTNSTMYGSWERVVTAPGGELYAVGNYRGEISLDSLVLNSQIRNKLLLAKYSESGNLIWANQASDAQVSSITTSPGGNLLISGSYYDDPLSFGTDSLPAPIETEDAFLACYNPGGIFQWAHNLTAQNNSEAYGVATDATGNVYQTGFFSGTASPGGISIIATNGDLFFLAYSPAGNLLLAQHSAPGGNDGGLTVTVDANNNLHLFGLFTGSFALPGSIVIQNSNIPKRDIFYASTSALLAVPPLLSEQQLFNLFPNPANDQVTLNFPENWASVSCQLRLMTLTSQQVFNKQLGINSKNVNIDLPELSPGFYILEVQSDNQCFRRRLEIR